MSKLDPRKKIKKQATKLKRKDDNEVRQNEYEFRVLCFCGSLFAKRNENSKKEKLTYFFIL